MQGSIKHYVRLGAILTSICSVPQSITAKTVSAYGTASAQVTEPILQMKLYIYNYAHVQKYYLSRAQRELAEVFEPIRVVTEWLDSSTRPKNPQADSVYSLMIFILGRSGEAAAPSSTALGFLATNQEGCKGPAAYVIYPRIENLVQKLDRATNQRSMGEVLAHVIAHEIGHLLLSTSSHSRVGIMRASWWMEEYNRLVTGHLRFTADQAELIRSELARRFVAQENFAACDSSAPEFSDH
jgi:hypothetical protein